jgi:hypothetical protein
MEGFRNNPFTEARVLSDLVENVLLPELIVGRVPVIFTGLGDRMGPKA